MLNFPSLTEGRAIRIPKHRIAELSREIIRWLPRKLPKGDRKLGSGLMHKGIPFGLRRADGKPVNVLIRIRSELPRGRNPYYVLSGGAGVLKRTGQPVVVIVLNGSLTGEVFRRAASPPYKGNPLHFQLVRVLKHELTHIADPSKGYAKGGSDIPSSDVMDLRAYYNQSTEVRAYLQEILDDLEHFGLGNYDRIKRVMGPSKALEYFLKGSDTWNEVSKYWTKRNRKYVIGAVARELASV